MEDGLAPGPSKDPLTVLAGEHGVLGEVGEGGGEGLGYCDAEEEEDSVDHVIVIPPPLTPLSALTGVTTTLSSVLQLPARLSLPSGDDKTRLSVTPDSTQINCCIRLSDYPTIRDIKHETPPCPLTILGQPTGQLEGRRRDLSLVRSLIISAQRWLISWDTVVPPVLAPRSAPDCDC